MKGQHLKKSFADINPFKKIPVVQDGNLLIIESCAGLRYIAGQYDGSGQWYPGQLQVRAKVDEYLDWQHLNTRAHGMGYFRNKVLLPYLKKCPADLAVVSEHSRELDRVQEQFTSYFLGPRPFITGDKPTIADLLAACEFEQPSAGGYKLKDPVLDYLARVKAQIGPDYDKVHENMKSFAQKCMN
ncbi:hypothetical protein Pmani_009031 [Petrolisthes manimaculis]|uniref:Glutathione S-transferase n=1 Tax=Petrolisthes manimaculis TaxID=1843537 RepID=A0AAE1Q568_9EUCA|nr:hypothetical protein Pmani_009031 [Petrolisthes manimaculis]